MRERARERRLFLAILAGTAAIVGTASWLSDGRFSTAVALGLAIAGLLALAYLCGRALLDVKKSGRRPWWFWPAGATVMVLGFPLALVWWDDFFVVDWLPGDSKRKE